MGTEDLRVSVIIPVYKPDDRLLSTIDSLDTQSTFPFEFIIVDDGSPKPNLTLNRLSAQKNVRVVIHPKNLGAGSARVTGGRIARGSILSFLDSDCLAPRDWIERILFEFRDDPSLVALGGGYSHPTPQGVLQHLARAEESYAHNFFNRSKLFKSAPGGNLSVRKSIWDKASNGKEIPLFRGIASGEDSWVIDEIKKLGKLKFSESIPVRHGYPSIIQFLRRHFWRGYSGAKAIFERKSANPIKGSLNCYGGIKLFLGSIAPLVAVPFIVENVILVFPFILWHLILSKDFFHFLKEAYPQIPLHHRNGIRVLLTLRSLLWVFGGTLGFLSSVKNYLNHKIQVVLSVAHFFFPRRISKLFFFVTSKCNARCSFCFNIDNVEKWKERVRSELTLPEIQKIAKALGRLPYLTLSGGEPFLRKDLAAIIQAFHYNAKSQWVTIPSNGANTGTIVSTTKDILSSCPRLFLTVQISVDGLYEFHDRSRKIKGGFEKLSMTLRSLNEIRKTNSNLRIQLATPFTNENQKQMDEIVDTCRREFHFDQHLLYLVRNARACNTTYEDGLIKKFLSKVREISEMELKGNREIKGLWAHAVRVLQNCCYFDLGRILEGEFVRSCLATKKFATLYDDGTITPCEIRELDILANIRDFDYDYYRIPNLKTFAQREIVSKRCQCDWMCAPPINMLYDPWSWFRIGKRFLGL